MEHLPISTGARSGCILLGLCPPSGTGPTGGLLIQLPDASLASKLLTEIGAPVATALGAIYFYHRFIMPKAVVKNGEESSKDLLHHFDMAITEHFDQLRRDLEVKIEKTVQNGLTAYLLESELRRGRRKEDR